MKLSYFDLTGKVAVVSGGATGIGLGMSEGLAEAGAKVVICSRRLEVCEQAAGELVEKTGGQVVGMRCDITKNDEIEGLVKQVVDTEGGIDILVNCAGIGGSEKPIKIMDDADWDSVMDINLKGAFNLARVAVQPMIKAGNGGRVINVASVAGVLAWRYMSAYCASKGGMIQLTKVMALEWMKHGILVNAILPGYFETSMNTHFFASEAGKGVIKNNIPLGRIAQISEIKGLTIYLASEASSFMTGSAVVIDGGHTIQ